MKISDTFTHFNVIEASIEFEVGSTEKYPTTTIELVDQACTLMYNKHGDRCNSIVFSIKGTAERETVGQALEFIGKQLQNIKGKRKND